MSQEGYDCYVGIDGKRYGPMSEKMVQDYHAQGKVPEDAKFFKTGMAEWIPLADSGLIAPSEPVIQPVKIGKKRSDKIKQKTGGIKMGKPSKKWWLAAACVVLVIAALGMAAFLITRTGCRISPAAKHIETVKNSSPDRYPESRYGESFDAYFTSPEWDYAAGEGQHEVIFKGECIFNGKDAQAVIRFTGSEGGSAFVAAALELDGEPMPMVVLQGLLDLVFEENVKSGETVPAMAQETETETEVEADLMPTGQKPTGTAFIDRFNEGLDRLAITDVRIVEGVSVASQSQDGRDSTVYALSSEALNAYVGIVTEDGILARVSVVPCPDIDPYYAEFKTVITLAAQAVYPGIKVDEDTDLYGDIFAAPEETTHDTTVWRMQKGGYEFSFSIFETETDYDFWFEINPAE